MTGQLFYPYINGPGDIHLDIDGRGEDLERNHGDDLLLYRSKGKVGLRFTVTTAEELEVLFLPEEEWEDPPFRIDLVLTSDESRRREVIPLGQQMESQWDMDYDPDEWSGVIRVEAVMSRTASRKPDGSGYATEVGARLAWSDPCMLIVEAPAPVATGNLEVLWEDFAESKDEWLRRHSANLWVLRPDDPPILNLNSGIEGAAAVLNNNAMHGAKARIRDMAFHQIALGAWSSILVGIMATLTSNTGEGEPGTDCLQVWERAILEDWAPHLFPELPAEAALSALLEQLADPGSANELTMSRVPAAIQTRLSVVKSFTGSCREHLGA